MTEKLENFNSMVKNIREDSSTFCLSLSRGQSSRASSMVGSVALAPKETVEQALLQLTTMAMDSFGLCSHGIRHLVRLWEMRPLRLRITSFALFGFERKAPKVWRTKDVQRPRHRDSNFQAHRQPSHHYIEDFENTCRLCILSHLIPKRRYWNPYHQKYS